MRSLWAGSAAFALVLLAAGCATLPSTAQPSLVLLPPYVSADLTGKGDWSKALVTAFGQALASSGRYTLRQKGFFESGYDEALARPRYSQTAVLEDAERTTLIQALSVSAVGLTDVLDDRQAHLWRLHFRVVDATGAVLEDDTVTIPWNHEESATVLVKASTVSVHPPEPGNPEPRLDRSGDWTLWWSLAPALTPDAERWKDALLAARFSGNHDEALRLADLILDKTTFAADSVRPSSREKKLLTVEDSWVSGGGAWLRQFLEKERQWDREDRDLKALLAALALPRGTAAEEDLALVRFLDLVRTSTRTSRADLRDEVATAFRGRFGQDLAVMLTRPPMVLVDGGTFRMGSEDEADERPVHTVTVGDFLMGRTEVTQEQYTGILGNNPSLFTQGSDARRQPVERVTWFDAVEYCIRLSLQDGLEPVYTLAQRNPEAGYPIKAAEVTQDRTKNGYRLPTEAEWEWASRGGKLSRGTLLSGGNDPALVAWTDGTAGPGPVAAKQPNELGLYDLSGNVWEWCSDWYGKYPAEAKADPSGPPQGILRVGRGGSWHAAAWNARVTARSFDNPGARSANLGFRVVRTVSLPSGN